MEEGERESWYHWSNFTIKWIDKIIDASWMNQINVVTPECSDSCVVSFYKLDLIFGRNRNRKEWRAK